MLTQCSSCYADLSDGAAFCAACGAPVTKPDPVPISAAQFPSACSGCGAALSKDAAFCSACGTAVVESKTSVPSCSSCGSALTSDAVFCGNCGTPVASRQAEIKASAPPSARQVGTAIAAGSPTGWMAWCHLSAFAGLLLPFVFNWFGPLIIWLTKRSEIPAVDDQGKESLNFQISTTIYALVLSVVLGVVSAFFGVVAGVFHLYFLMLFPLWSALMWFLFIPFGIAWVVFVVIAAVKASSGTLYRYPLTIRLIK